ncbi:MAG: tRNA (N6-isopentenyl adenosine(37)-C2)-methylthiotransferase MiaB [Candidatus Omnitrophica bacterium]|nr:tRNA (N6-isopentenyl adenosine(37)-C2)-methylthiotransferase MiaB [Candidatus Omnitrophota bacterium]
MHKKVYLKVFGCQMNAYDSEIVEAMLGKAGYMPAGTPDEADIILFNTCSVRAHAEERAFGNVMALRPLKEKHPEKIIGIIGCMAQNYGEALLEKAPFVDLICGPDRMWDIPAFVEEIRGGRGPVIACELDGRAGKSVTGQKKRLKAYVAIMRGCDNFCTYCVVPYVRGRERSREVTDIVNEVAQLLDNGVKEITLLGQNVNSYGKNLADGITIARLLERLDSLPYKKRIRFLTSHPKDISPDLISAMRDLESVCEHLHLPIQSGSDRILETMGRGYAVGHFLDIARSFKENIPAGSLTTDVIVGFPGESEEDFQATVNVMKKIQFDDSFIFKYSPREKTKAAALTDDVPKKVKEERNQILLSLQKEITAANNQCLIGTTLEVLVETPAKKSRGEVMGRSRAHKKVVFAANGNCIGEYIPVEITGQGDFTLTGRAHRAF